MKWYVVSWLYKDWWDLFYCFCLPVQQLFAQVAGCYGSPGYTACRLLPLSGTLFGGGGRPSKTSKGILVLCLAKHLGGLVGVFHSACLVPRFSASDSSTHGYGRTTGFGRPGSKAVHLMKAAAVIQRTLGYNLPRRSSTYGQLTIGDSPASWHAFCRLSWAQMKCICGLVIWVT